MNRRTSTGRLNGLPQTRQSLTGRLSAAGGRPEQSHRARRAHRGASSVELLLALPVILLLGLGIIQYTLVYQAKHALDHALNLAARQGALDHASGESLRAGLAAGLVPYLHGATDWASLLQAEDQAAGHVDEGATAGWIRLVQRSPMQESFDDWAEPALDEVGDPIAGIVEIPNDNLDSRRLRMQPVSGVAALHLSEPIGRLSGQTLADANLLRLELVYGVRLVVPVVAQLIVRMLSVWNRCPSAEAGNEAQGPNAGARMTLPGSGEGLGLLVLGTEQASSTAQPWMCAFINARGASGRLEPRIPIRASATVRMMSTARRSDLTRSRTAAASGQIPSGPDGVGSDDRDAMPDPATGSDPGSDRRGGSTGGDGTFKPVSGASASANLTSTPAGLTNGFLGIGSDRPYGMPVAHPALCPS